MKQIVQCRVFDEFNDKTKTEWFVGEPEEVDGWKSGMEFELANSNGKGYNVFNTFEREEILSMPLEKLKGFILRDILKIVL